MLCETAQAMRTAALRGQLTAGCRWRRRARTSARRCGWAAVLLAIGAASGCSTRRDFFDRKPTVKVKGVVFAKGKPAAGALVTFMRFDGPDSEYPGAQGIVNTDGTYELTTYTTKDGVIAGDYIVTIVWPTRPDWWNADEEMSALDRLKGKYAPGKSEIRRTIREDTDQVEPIELN